MRQKLGIGGRTINSNWHPLTWELLFNLPPSRFVDSVIGRYDLRASRVEQVLVGALEMWKSSIINTEYAADTPRPSMTEQLLMQV